MKAIFVLIVLMGLIGCGSGEMYPRTVGQKGVESFCVEANRMGRVEDNVKLKDMFTLAGDTVTIHTDFESIEPSNPDTSLATGVDLTFVVADETCKVYFSKKKFFPKQGGAIPIKYEIPYNPSHYFYYVYSLRF
jgi:hypothetical protein